MKYRVRIPLLVITMMVGSLASAASVHQKRIEDEAQDISVPLSKSALDIEISAEQAQRERMNQPTGALELGISSWEPGNLQPLARIHNSTSFSLAGPPALELNTIQPVNRELALVAGMSFISLKRTGTLDSAGLTSQEQQTAYVPSLRLGAQYAPLRISTQAFRPYLAGALLPTAVITNRSSFDDGETDLGFAGELGAGTLVHLSAAFDVDVSVSETLGKVKGSSLDGFGVNAGVRMPL